MNCKKFDLTANAIDNQEKEPNKNFGILIRNGNRKPIIDYQDNIYAQGLKDYTILQTARKKYVVKGSVKTIDNYLPLLFFHDGPQIIHRCKAQKRIVHKNKINWMIY